MSKGPSQVGTQTTTQTNPTGQAQLPYLQDIWGQAQNINQNQPEWPYPNNTWANPDPTGYQSLNQQATSNIPNAANAAANPFYQGTSGGYSGYNSPAYGGYANVAGGNTYGQQVANQGVGNLQGLAGTVAQAAANTGAAVADPMALMRQQASGYYLNSNPYLDQMYGNAAGQLTQAYQTGTAPRTASSFEGAGRYGSPSAQNAVSQNEQNLGRSLGTLAGNIYGQNYANERSLQNAATANLGQLDLNAQQQMLQGYGQAGNMYGAAGNLGLSGTSQQLAGLGGLQGGYQTGNSQAMQAAGMLPTIQQGYAAGPQGQITADAGLQAQQQAALDASYKQWMTNSQWPWSQLQLYSQAIGQPISAGSTSTQPVYGSGIGQTLGGIGSALSGIGSVAALFSDRRLKEDTQVVGRVGKLPVHLFRYKGDPTPRIGFMADEVEKVDPGAVMTTNLGFKAVDYGRAAASALQE